jgi:hypothetical protein
MVVEERVGVVKEEDAAVVKVGAMDMEVVVMVPEDLVGWMAGVWVEKVSVEDLVEMMVAQKVEEEDYLKILVRSHWQS